MAEEEIIIKGRGLLYRLWQRFLWRAFHKSIGGCKINGKPDVHIKFTKANRFITPKFKEPKIEYRNGVKYHVFNIRGKIK